MMPTLIIVLLILVAAGVVLVMLPRGKDNGTVLHHEREELQQLRGLVDDLKETAWEHRELDSMLSTIIIDKIRTFERRDRGGRGELGS